MSKRLKIADLKFDPQNARVRTAKGEAMIQESLRSVGAARSIVIDEDGTILAGNGTVEAAGQVGIENVVIVEASGDEIIAVKRVGLTDEQKKKLAYYDNRTGDEAEWDMEQVARDLLGGYEFLDELFDNIEVPAPDKEGTDELPENPAEVLREKWGVEYGDLWQIGNHRILCGDSTKADDIRRLMGGDVATLLHADPPYGMGKEAEGVQNDNLYKEKLDAFQMSWWSVCRPHLTDNASAYVWGNAPDLWRLWYNGGLQDFERLELRNEIVWGKGNAIGMSSPLITQYPVESERCLFFQIGDQFLGNVNAGDFPESWEPIRSYMEGAAGSAGIQPADIRRVCGCQMYGHWFTKSQFTLIPQKHYIKLQKEYPGAFNRTWQELKKEWDRVKGGPTSEIQAARSYFDNTHDNMTDVWLYPRVVGDERWAHATPKPVDMIARAIKSSTRKGDIVLEPFSGGGSTLAAAHNEGRTCYAMEIDPAYVAVCIERMAQLGYDPDKVEKLES